MPANWASVTPVDLVRSVTRRLPSVIFTAMVVTVVVVGVLIAWPNRYGSDGLMYVRLGRANLSIDPTAQNSGSQGVSVQETRLAEVLSVAEMIGSREIAERVVRKIGAETINQPRSWTDRAKSQMKHWVPKSGKNAPEGMTHEDYEAQLDHEDAVENVRDWLKVDVAKNGYTVALAAKGPDALLVQSITQAAMDEYRRYHVEAHHSVGSLEFFEQQVAASRDSAVQARTTLQEARSELGWMSIESAEETLQDRIVALEVSLDEAQSQYAEAKHRSEALQLELGRTKEWIPTEITKGIANAASDSIRTQLYDEQVLESEALAALRPDHPRFRMLQEKMTRSKEIAGSETKHREQSREAINPVRLQLESEYTLANASASGLEGKCESLEESLVDARKNLQRLNHDAVTLARLKWQADIDQDTLMDHAKSLEEARVIAELDRKNMSDVSVIQNASLNLKKVGPPRTILACVGAMLGLALGVLQALLRDTTTVVAVRPVTPRTGAVSADHDVSDRIDRAHGPVADTEPSGQIDEDRTDEVVSASSSGGVLPR